MSWFTHSTSSLAGAFWKYRWTFLVPIATLVLPATIYALRLPPTFDAVAIVQVKELQNENGRATVVGVRAQQANTLVSLARDRLLKTDNVKALRKWLAPGGSENDPSLIAELAEYVEYDRLGSSSFKVKITHTDPVIAMQACNAIVNAFVQGERAEPLQKAEIGEAFFRKRRDLAETAVDEAMTEVATFLDKHPDVLKGTSDFLSRQLATTDQNLQNAQQRATKAKAEEEEFRRKTLDEPSEVGAKSRRDSTEEIRLKGQLKTAQESLGKAKTHLAQMETKYQPDSKRVRVARENVERHVRQEDAIVDKLGEERLRQDKRWLAKIKIDTRGVREQLKKQLERASVDYQNAHAAVESLREEASVLRKRIAKIPGWSLKLRPLTSAQDLRQKDFEECTKAHMAALQKLEYFRNAQADAVTPYTITQPAVVPVKPSGPSRMKFLLSALVLGGLLGYGIMLLRRKFDEGSNVTPEDIAGLLPGALVVSVPRLGGGGPKRKPAGLALDVVCAAWVCAALGTTVLAVAIHKEILAGPPWLRSLIGVDA